MNRVRSWARILKLARSLLLNSNVTLKVNSLELVVDSSFDLEVLQLVSYNSLTYHSSCCHCFVKRAHAQALLYLLFRSDTEISCCCRTRALIRRVRNLSTCRERKQLERKKEERKTRAERNCMCNMTLKSLPAWVDCPFLCQHSDNTL